MNDELSSLAIDPQSAQTDQPEGQPVITDEISSEGNADRPKAGQDRRSASDAPRCHRGSATALPRPRRPWEAPAESGDRRNPPESRDGPASVAALAVQLNKLRREVESLTGKLDTDARAQREEVAVLADIVELREQVKQVLSTLADKEHASPAEWFWRRSRAERRRRLARPLGTWRSAPPQPGMSWCELVCRRLPS